MFKREIALIFAFSTAIAGNNFQSENTMRQLNHEMIKAVLADSVDDIIRLVRAGADINYSENDVSPISIALRYQKQAAIKKLLELKVRIDSTNNVFGTMIQSFDVKTLWNITKQLPEQFRLHKKMIINRILHSYSDDTTLELFRDIILMGYSSAQELWTETINPSNMCFIGPKTLRFFLEYGADPNYVVTTKIDDTCTSSSCSSSYSCSFSAEAAANVIVYEPAYTPLSFCISKGGSYKENMSLLLSHGANINLKAKFDGRNSSTLLSWALRGGCSQEAVELLIANGATL
jgi:ankyrin repeat protein